MLEILIEARGGRPNRDFLELLGVAGKPELDTTALDQMSDEDVRELYGHLFDLADWHISRNPPRSVSETLTYDFQLNLLSALNGGRDHMAALREFGYTVNEVDERAVLEGLATWLRSDLGVDIESEPGDAVSSKSPSEQLDAGEVASEHAVALGITAVVSVAVELDETAADEAGSDDGEADDPENIDLGVGLTPDEYADAVLDEVQTEETGVPPAIVRALKSATLWRPPPPTIREPVESVTTPSGLKVRTGGFTMPGIDERTRRRFRSLGDSGA